MHCNGMRAGCCVVMVLALSSAAFQSVLWMSTDRPHEVLELFDKDESSCKNVMTMEYVARLFSTIAFRNLVSLRGKNQTFWERVCSRETQNEL